MEVVIVVGVIGFCVIVLFDVFLGVFEVYVNSINKVFYLVVVIVVFCGLVLWGMGWKDLWKKLDGDSEIVDKEMGVFESQVLGGDNKGVEQRGKVIRELLGLCLIFVLYIFFLIVQYFVQVVRWLGSYIV